MPLLYEPHKDRKFKETILKEGDVIAYYASSSTIRIFRFQKDGEVQALYFNFNGGTPKYEYDSVPSMAKDLFKTLASRMAMCVGHSTKEIIPRQCNIYATYAYKVIGTTA